VVITYRGSDLNPATTPSLRSRAGRLLSQLAALRARRIVCVSRELRQRLWWRSHRVTVLASGVDPAVFRPGPRAGARRILGWPDGDRVVLFNAGRDPWNKRLDLALAAARSARRQVPSLRLEVLDGQLDPERMPSLMRAADCLLVTSDYEGSPSVVQEALATNLPVVSVAVGDVPACLEGVTNTRVVGRDPEALAAALVELVREPRRTNGRERIGEFSAQRIARELREIYEAAAKPTRHD
jgi:glycosyltransferase involved in cell wall biosynthesis